MPSMPVYFVGKGRQFGVLDHQFGGQKADYMAAYAAALGRISGSLADLAGEHAAAQPGPPRVGLTPGDAQHFEQHWLDGDWWPGKQVEEVLRAGYRAAIERAHELELPIESLWVCANEDQFQVYICEGPRQVTVIVFTPPPPRHGLFSRTREHSDEALTQDEPIWVVKVKDKHDDEYTEHGASDYDVVDTTNQIIKRRVRYEGPASGGVRTS